VLGQIETIFTLADPLDRAAFSVAGENIIELNEIITWGGKYLDQITRTHPVRP
jgi:hypothetical protein